LIVDEEALRAVGFQPFFIYRDAIARGYLLYQPDPSEVLEPVRLSQLHPNRNSASWADRVIELGLPSPARVQERLKSGHSFRFAYAGDRIALAECLIDQLSPEAVPNTSFSTSLVPSSDRPFLLTLVNEISK